MWYDESGWWFMKRGKRKQLRYRLTSWVVIALLGFQSGPMQLLAALDDAARAQAPVSGFAGRAMPVDLEKGALLLPLEDLVFHNAAPPLRLGRIYRSDLAPDYPTLFGRRWHALPDMRLRFEGEDTARLIDEQGRERVYRRSSEGVFVSQHWEYEEIRRVESDGDARFERTLAGGLKHCFEGDGEHRLVEVRDRNGRSVRILREPRLITLTDRHQRWIQIILKDGYAAAAVDSTGRSVRYAHDAQGNLVSVVTFAGGSYQMTYDDAGRLLRLDLGPQRWYAFKYRDGALAEQRGIAGLIEKYERASKNGTAHVTITDAVGTAFKVAYSDSAVRIDAPDGTVTETVRNARRLPVRMQTAAGGVLELAYNERSEVVTASRNGAVTRIAYNAAGLPEKIALPDGVVESYRYDPAGNPVAMESTAGNTTTLEWNQEGLPVRLSRGDGRSIAISYGPQGLPRSVSDNAFGTRRFTYYDNGLLRSSETPAGVESVFTYNAAETVTAIVNSEGQRIAFEYDGYGNISAVTDSAGNRALYQYGPMGMPLSVLDPAGALTQFEWRADGTIEKHTDAVGNVALWEYDDAGRLCAEVDAAGARRLLRYDQAGRIAGYVNSREQTVAFGYDGFGRRTSVNSASGPSTFLYDGCGRLELMKNADTEFRALYNAAGQIESIQDGVLKRDVSYTYDSLGRRSTMKTADGIVTYSYDSVGRIAEVSRDGLGIRFAYDSIGRRSGLHYSNGVNTAYVYDRLGRLTSVSSVNAAGETVASVAYAYNALDQVVRAVDDQGVDRQYAYDAAGRLIKVSEGASLTEYLYDAVGNRSAVIRDGVRTEYQSAPGNRLLQAGGESFAYDADGNMVSRKVAGGEVYTYAYDEFNRMVSAAGPAGSARYKYAPNGIMAARVEGESEVRREFDGGDVVALVSGGAAEAAFVHGPEVDEWLAEVSGGALRGLHPDRIGSVLAHSDETGGVLHRFRYDEFGRPSEAGRASPGAYTGREWDPVANLQYNRARFYCPETGRFNAIDPMGFTQGPNRYAYAANNPLSFKDPDGCVIFTGAVLTAIAVGAVAGGLIDLGWQGISNWRNDKNFFDDLSGWSIAGSTLLGALAPVIAAMAAPGAAAAGVIGAIITKLAPLGPLGVRAVLSAVTAGIVGALEYVAKTPWKDIKLGDFFWHVSNRIGSFILGNEFGNWLSGFRFHANDILHEVYTQVIGVPVAYVYNWISENILPQPSGGGSGTGVQSGGGSSGGSGGPSGGGPSGGSGGSSSGGPSGGSPGGGSPGGGGAPGGGSGGDNQEYKRFQRFENWSTSLRDDARRSMAA